MKIAILDDYSNAFVSLDCYARLSEHEVFAYRDTEKDPAKLAARLKDFDAVVLTQQRSPFPRAAIDKVGDRLKLIAQTGRNTAHIDIAACTEKGIAVAVKEQGTPHATAELTWGLILAALRNIPREVDELKRGVWQTTVGTGLRGKILGIYAYGRIGSLVAEVGRAFGMRVVCWGREGSLARAQSAGYEVAASREAFFESVDVLALHLPLNGETRGIVTGADLSRMKATSLLVNTSRAPIIATGALVAALTQGRPGSAAVDVYEDEPVTGGNHPLLKMTNATCTPHLGYVEKSNLELNYGSVIDSILGFARGEPVNVMNPQALKS